MAEDVIDYDEINWDRLYYYFDYNTYLDKYYEEIDESEVITEEDLANMTDEELTAYYSQLC